MTTRACRTQAQRLRSWAEKFDERVWAVESANGFGYLLARQLVAAGERVVDVPPAFSARTRVLGLQRSQKNDPNDAHLVAITALRQPGLQLVRPDDHAKVKPGPCATTPAAFETNHCGQTVSAEPAKRQPASLYEPGAEALASTPID